MKIKTCTCGQSFAAKGNTRYCDECREAKYNATHPLRTCERCGQETRTMGRDFCFCNACLKATLQANQAKARQRRGNGARLDYLQRFQGLDLEQKAIVVSAALQFMLKRLIGGTAEEQEVEVINPEQVAADDQERIDATFAEIMEGVDW